MSIKEIISPDSAFLRRPSAVAIGLDGLIYVADTGNNRLVALNDSGDILFESSGGNSAGELRWPVDVAVGVNGRIYVVDTGKRRIVEFTRLLEWKGELTPRSESGEELEPRMVAASEKGELYVYEADNGQFLKYDNFYSVVAKLGGQRGDPVAIPVSLCISRTDGIIWVEGGDNKLYHCDTNLSNASLWPIFGNDLCLYQVACFDSTLFVLEENVLYRRNGLGLDAISLQSIGIEANSVKDIRMEAVSNQKLYFLDLRRGSLHSVYWP